MKFYIRKAVYFLQIKMSAILGMHKRHNRCQHRLSPAFPPAGNNSGFLEKSVCSGKNPELGSSS